MNIKLLICFYLFFNVIINSYANSSERTSCKLDSSEVITIGCTTKCSNVYTSAIKSAALKLKFRVEFVTLIENKPYDYHYIISNIDGIISPGGHDIDPSYYTVISLLTNEDRMTTKQLFYEYGKSNASGRARDAFEYELFKHYFTDTDHKNVPVLGICYGMQMLAVVRGIPLYVHIPIDIKIPARRRISDQITLSQQSSLMPFINSDIFSGYKNHHQAINIEYFRSFKSKGRFTDISITGTSNNGRIAEVLEIHDRPVIGVQFHPEKSENKIKIAVFSRFLIDACLRKLGKIEP